MFHRLNELQMVFVDDEVVISKISQKKLLE
jgi:hypothetical protein